MTKLNNKLNLIISYINSFNIGDVVWRKDLFLLKNVKIIDITSTMDVYINTLKRAGYLENTSFRGIYTIKRKIPYTSFSNLLYKAKVETEQKRLLNNK